MEESSINKDRIIDRFDKYVIFKGLNDNRVTIDLKISVGTLGKSRMRNRDLSRKNIELILNFYTDLNETWLLTGNCEMLKTALQIEPDASAQASANSTTGMHDVEHLYTLIEKKDKEIQSLNRLIGKLENQIDILKKNLAPQSDNVVYADAK